MSGRDEYLLENSQLWTPKSLTSTQIQYILIKKVNYSFRKAFISFLLVGFLFSLAPSICLLLSTV